MPQSIVQNFVPTYEINLKNLQRLHWKRASRSIHGLMLTSPLRHVHNADDKPNKIDKSNVPLLRPQDLR